MNQDEVMTANAATTTSESGSRSGIRILISMTALGLGLMRFSLLCHAQSQTDLDHGTENRPQEKSEDESRDWSKLSYAEVREAAERGDPTARFHLGRSYEMGAGVQRDYQEAARHYRIAAEQGHAIAQNNLGNLYQQGLGVPRNLIEAEKWFRKSAEQGEPYGQANLGWMYHSGRGLPRDRELAEYWFRKAAEQGFTYAQFMMGQLAERQGVQGSTVVGNYQVASEWYEKAALQGHVKAMFELGDLYYYGKLGHNYPEAARWFRMAAGQGDDEAALRLGELHSRNRTGLPADSAEAIRWYRRVAEKGNPEAQFKLGCLLADQPDNSEMAEARRWLKEAVANGYAEASVKLASLNDQPVETALSVVNREELVLASYRDGSVLLMLGRSYEEGLGGPTNIHAASEIYWKILNQGPARDQPEASRRLIDLYFRKMLTFDDKAIYGPKDGEAFAGLLQGYSRLMTAPQSQFQIGDMFLRGDMLPVDKPRAVEWLTRAANSGSAEAMSRLGELWAEGLDGAPDPEEAVAWYRRAANRGLAAAQLKVGLAFQHGEGVGIDKIEAAAWLSLAAEQQNPTAVSKLAVLRSSLTVEQLEAADRRARKLADEVQKQSTRQSQIP